MTVILRGGLDMVRAAVRSLAARRREAGFARITVWVPQESAPEIRRAAQRLVAKCGRRMPGGAASDEEFR
jgi:hypothetical protein